MIEPIDTCSRIELMLAQISVMMHNALRSSKDTTVYSLSDFIPHLAMEKPVKSEEEKLQEISEKVRSAFMRIADSPNTN